MQSPVHQSCHIPRWLPRNQSRQVKRSSNKRALFNFGVSHFARASHRVGRGADFDNPFTKESKHVPGGASSPSLSVGMIDKIDEMPGGEGITFDDRRTNFGPSIGWCDLSFQRIPPSSVARAIKRAKDVPEGILCARPGFALPNRSRPCGVDGWTLSHLRHPRHSSLVLLRWAHMSSLTSERREWKRDSRPDRPLNARNVSLWYSGEPMLE